MSAAIAFSCDSDWLGFPCRGGLTTRTTVYELAEQEALAAGWLTEAERLRRGEQGAQGDLCHSHALHWVLDRARAE